MDIYLWVKAGHIVSVIAWMAGLLYLPRLFVYHAEVEPDSARAQMLTRMEARLYRFIMTPAMAATIGFGGWLIAIAPIDWTLYWLYVKLALVVGLAGFHELLGHWRRALAAGRNRRPQRFYRFVNEVPTIVMIAIVILAIVKPF